MAIGSLFNAGSSIGPGLFEDVLKNQDYSQVFGDTSTAFGGNTVDLFGGGGGWNFVEPGNSNTPDFSNIFSSPAPGGLSLSQGFNSPGNLFEPSKGLTFDPGSVNKLESILDDVARGGMPKDFVRTDVPSAGSRSRFPTGLVPSANPNPVRSRPAAGGSITQPPRPKPGSIEAFNADLKKDQWQRFLYLIRNAEGTQRYGSNAHRVKYGGSLIPQEQFGSGFPKNVREPAGAYQVKPGTYEDVMRTYGPGIGKDFNTLDGQSRLALGLTRRRDPALYDKISNGQNVSFDEMKDMIHAVSNEWASLPTKRNTSAYNQPYKRMEELRRLWNEYQPPTYGSVSQ